jgi:hypothetical protein
VIRGSLTVLAALLITVGAFSTTVAAITASGTGAVYVA